MSTLDPIISSVAESPEPVLSMPSTTVPPIVPRLVETPILLDTEIPQNMGKAALPTTNVTPKLTPPVLPVLQSLTVLTQTLLVTAGMPLPDPESVVSYSPDSTATILVKTLQQNSLVSGRTDTGTETAQSFSVPKLSDLTYAVVSRHNLLDFSTTCTGETKRANLVTDKQDQDIIVLGEAHILDYKNYLKTVAASNKLKVVLTQLTCQKIKDKTSCVPHWSQLDPYSSLEEAEDSSVVDNSEHSSDTRFMPSTQSRYKLWERTCTYQTVRQCHSTTSTMFYRDMCAIKHSAVISQNKKPRPGLKSPSDDRIATQQKIMDNLNGKTPPMAPTPKLDVKHQSATPGTAPQPVRHSTKSEVEARHLINSYPLFDKETEPSDSDATIEYDIPKEMLPAEEPTPMGKLVMSKTFGIKCKLDKSKRKRNYQ